MTRWKASAIHFTLSVLILSTIAAILVWRWYPPGLFHMARADKLLLVIAGVDVVMGPLLTLIIFRQGKKGLKFDLTVIALLQVAAMAYGLHTVWQSRPVYLVALADRFRLVFASDLDPEDLAQAAPGFRRLPWLTVETIAAHIPENQKEREDLLFSSLDTGKDIDQQPRYYGAFDDTAAAYLRDGSPTARAFFNALSGDDAVRFDAAIQRTGAPLDQLKAAPIRSTRGDATMLLDARTGRPVKPVAVDPLSALIALSRKARRIDGPKK